MEEPNTLFWLIPQNPPAAAIVGDPRNKFRFREMSRSKGNVEPTLRVGFDDTPKIPGQLISFGRDPARSDVILSERRFSKTHCHLHVHRQSSEIVLRDTSARATTQLILEDSLKKYFLQGIPRQRVLPRLQNIGIRIENAEFEILWAKSSDDESRAARIAFAAQKLPDELAATSFTVDTQPETAHFTRVQTPQIPELLQRAGFLEHHKHMFLGAGSFAQVHQTVDLSSGDLFAVKTISFDPNKPLEEKRKKELYKREIELHSRISHSHIAEFKHAQGWQAGLPLEIFMPVYSGTLTHLIPEHNCKVSAPMRISRPPFFVDMANQMLRALIYLHSQNILHRDVKPDNILYNINRNANAAGEAHSFYLADFGLSKFQDFSRTRAGSMLYMAPEVINASDTQTSKLDVWSLGVVFLQVLGCFCSSEVLSLEKWGQTIQSFLKHETTFIISPMLAIDVANRYTAQECYNKFFNQTPPTRPKSAPSQDPPESSKKPIITDATPSPKKPNSQSPPIKQSDTPQRRLRRRHSRPTNPVPPSRTPIRKTPRQSKTPDTVNYFLQRHTRQRPPDRGL
ncbi:hypothetical protein FQN54_005640 [Arachnomyces sp. PD_36]|nr:hypothetical protein FQN54_005640 [Arachnomyces sp. PD_36]